MGIQPCVTRFHASCAQAEELLIKTWYDGAESWRAVKGDLARGNFKISLSEFRCQHHRTPSRRPMLHRQMQRVHHPPACATGPSLPERGQQQLRETLSVSAIAPASMPI